MPAAIHTLISTVFLTVILALILSTTPQGGVPAAR